MLKKGFFRVFYNVVYFVENLLIVKFSLEVKLFYFKVNENLLYKLKKLFYNSKNILRIYNIMVK